MMKTGILAGGTGTRLQELTALVPKPMVEIGSRPILWHIMKIFSGHGFQHFCVALGYKGHLIKEFFVNYPRLVNSLRVDLGTGAVSIHEQQHENWVVDLIETGAAAQTGARLARLKRILGAEAFFFTYGDGVGSVDLRALLDFHRRMGRIATVTAVRPPAKFGALDLDGSLVGQFTEKPVAGEGWVNGGFYVFEPRVFDYLSEHEGCVLERDPLENLARDDQLAAFKHPGFWHCMDTIRDVDLLNDLWRSGTAPWKIWND